MESAYIGNCHPYYVSLFLLILKFLERQLSHVFVLRIVKILSRFYILALLSIVLVCVSRVENILRWKVRRLENVTQMWHSHGFVQGI